MYGNHISVLYAEVMPDNTVDTCTPIIQLVIGQDYKNGILALLALDQDGVTAE